MTAMSGATPQRVTLTVAVDVDPVAHGFDLPDTDKQAIVRRAINARPGLEVISTNDRLTAGTGEAQ